MAWDADWDNIYNAPMSQIDPYLADLEYALHERESVFKNITGGSQSLLISHQGFERITTYLNDFEAIFSQFYTASTNLNAPPDFVSGLSRYIYAFLKQGIPFPTFRSSLSEYEHPHYTEQDYLDSTGYLEILTPARVNFLTNQGLKDILLQRKKMFDLMLLRWYPGVFLLQGTSTNCAERIIELVAPTSDITTDTLDANIKPEYVLERTGKNPETQNRGVSCKNNIKFDTLFHSFTGFPVPGSFDIDVIVEQTAKAGSNRFIGTNFGAPQLFQEVTGSSGTTTYYSILMGGGPWDWSGVPDPFFPDDLVQTDSVQYRHPGIVVDFDVPGGFKKTLNAA